MEKKFKLVYDNGTGPVITTLWGMMELEREELHLYAESYQFTGLLDKNDVEIYEGDIIQYSFGKYKEKPREIRFDKEKLQFALWSGKYFTSFDGVNIRDIEIIGNIYDRQT